MTALSPKLRNSLDSIKEIESNISQRIFLPAIGSWPKAYHVFESRDLWAIKAALTAERPLLIRGEPGTGKSQFARAAAVILKRAFLSAVVNAHTECSELQYKYDAVTRLGEAQSLCLMTKGIESPDIGAKLHPSNFVSPGVLWWAFDWNSAKAQYECFSGDSPEPEIMKGCDYKNGSVVLIDEIDKAEADLPNGLLETLGNGAFTIPYAGKSIGMSAETPLVIITTNEERELPMAFIRRCLVLHLELPDESKLIDWLVERGKIHFAAKCHEDVMREAACQLIAERADAIRDNLPRPGQAEYLDMLRTIDRLGGDKKKQLISLENIRDFALRKNAPEA